ncbi:hypothetical protein KCP78_02330 [Salmonella enterica subsp. enterica]|nr:hypothetical protein KCP78_02330 [Salmonella enterica subsp. enterica]
MLNVWSAGGYRKRKDDHPAGATANAYRWRTAPARARHPHQIAALVTIVANCAGRLGNVWVLMVMS